MANEYQLSFTAAEIDEKLRKIDNLAEKSDLPSKLSDLADDSSHRTVSDTEKSTWNAKSNFSGNYNDLTNKPTIPSIAGLASESYVDSKIASIPTPDVSGQINTHNVATDSHNDIRLLVEGLTTRLNTLANSDDTTLDQMSEIVAYIKNNKSLIDSITTNKVNVSDIIDNLTTNVSNKPLSAAQGVALKSLIDEINVPTKVSQLTNDSKYLTSYTETDPTVPDWAKQASKPRYTASEIGLGNVENVKQYSVNNPPIVAQAEAPSDTNVFWVDTDDESCGELSDAINTALAQAKASGEFDGKTPVKGIDYFTIADQEAIVQQVIVALGTPVFGRVDADNNIILTGTLVDGTYTLKYEDADANVTEIGTIEIGGVSYTNLADPTSNDWAVNKQLNSSAELTDAEGCHTTNFFKCAKGDVIRVKGLDIRYTNSEHTQNARAFFFNADGYSEVGAYPLDDPKFVFDGVDMFTITLDGLINISGGQEEDIVRGRLSGMLFNGYTADDVIITVNQQITDSDDEPTYTNMIPLSTEVDGVTLYNGGKGYKENTRWSSSGGGDTSATGTTVSGYIPVTYGDIIRIKNITMNKNTTANNSCHVCGFTSLGTGSACDIRDDVYNLNCVYDESGNLIQFTVANENWTYIRLNTAYIGADSILTINEEITDSNEPVNWLWNGIDTDGSIFNNGAGWQDGYRLTSSNAYEAIDGMSVTGYIPVKVGNTIVIENAMAGSKTSYIHWYDSNFNWIKGGSASDYATSGTNPNFIITVNTENTAYFRYTARFYQNHNTHADTIITVY